MKQPRYRRRKYFIKKDSQARFILRFVGISLAGGLAAVALFVYLGGKKMDTVLYSMILPGKSAAKLLLPELLWINGAIILFIATVLLFTANRLLNTLNGPLRKIAADLRRATEGDLTIRTVLRKEDEFQDTAAEINAAIQTVHSALSTCREQLQRIESLAQQDTADPEALAKEIHTLASCSQKFLV